MIWKHYNVLKKAQQDSLQAKLLNPLRDSLNKVII